MEWVGEELPGQGVIYTQLLEQTGPGWNWREGSFPCEQRPRTGPLPHSLPSNPEVAPTQAFLSFPLFQKIKVIKEMSTSIQPGVWYNLEPGSRPWSCSARMEVRCEEPGEGRTHSL